MTKEKRCHPELVSGSHYSIYPLVFVYKIYEMPKQVRHDSLVCKDNLTWVRWGKKVEKYTRCRNKFGMTFKKRGGIPTSTPHPQQKPLWFSPSPDAHASPSPLKGEGILVAPTKLSPYTPNCHAELILNCHAELVSASLLQPTENQLRSPTQLCVLINADATHNESPIRGFALISSFLQN